MKTMVKIVSTGLMGICLTGFLVSGCGDKPEPPEMESEAVVRQIVPGAETRPEAAVSPVSPDAPAAAQPAETADAAEATAEDEKKAADQPDKDLPPEEIAAETPAPVPGEEATRVEPEIEPDMVEASGVEADPPVVIEYDFEEDDGPGEVPAEDGPAAEDGTGVSAFYNPFAPLFKKESAASTDMSDIGVREKRKFLTPLERIDLGQLQLEGIILAQSGNRAIVTDASGKGYVITRGTYIGLNSGIVESIESDRVVVTEEVGSRAQKVVLKLQKPAGE